MTDRLTLARLIALLLPAALLAGAWGSQLFGGLVPCEMCHWQRWPHYTALLLAAAAFVMPGRGNQAVLVALAALAIGISGVIGVLHAGVEYHLWQGFTSCTSNLGNASSDADMLARIMHAPVIRCDQPQWTLFGISLAGFNAVISLTGALAIGGLLAGRRRAA